MSSITVREAVERMKSGRIFRVTFRKRTTHELRTMLGRYGVKSHLRGGERAYDFKEKNLLCVFDLVKHDYRTIPLEGLVSMRIGGEEREVVKDD